ncbi:MAG: hypothetical protein R6V47_06365 [Candidatus Delongbacteria bacterium]
MTSPVRISEIIPAEKAQATEISGLGSFMDLLRRKISTRSGFMPNIAYKCEYFILNSIRSNKNRAYLILFLIIADLF